MPADTDQLATVVISRAIRAGREDAFDTWVERIERDARSADGHLASLRLGQTAGLQHLIFRFDDRNSAVAWQGGKDFRRLTEEADTFSVGLDQTKLGDPVCFELPSDASAAKWKRFVTTWIAVFPILLAISTVVRWLLQDVPPALQLVPSSLMLTAALQWLVLPRLQRWSRFWVLKNGNGDLKTD